MSIAGVTNPDAVIEAGFGWDHDARYYYYDHGPLARTELGDNLVQGVDYAYTLQGWLKGVNSNELDPTKDMGHDGATGPNQNVAADAFSFSLHYNTEDYQSIGGAAAQQWLKDMAGTALEADRKDLWNGNIGMMLTNISLPASLTPGANDRPGLLGNVYAYDQLNRLKEARSDWDNGSGFGATYHTTAMYLNTFNYDANGNILNQKRNNQLGNTIDDLRYTYDGTSPSNMVNNRLYSVFDQVASSTFDDDIDAEDMTNGAYDYSDNTDDVNANGNYQYTKIGELKSDEQEQIEEIVWRVDSKISEVRRTSGSSKKTLRFGYDAMGNRTAKYVYNDASMTQLHSSTYYVHDATGNVMAVYEKLEVATNARSTNFALIERHIFGSSRLGMDNSPVEYLADSPEGRAPYSSSEMLLMRILSQKQYKLTNHLGNVLATISDRKLFSVLFSAEVVSSSDYSPFGVTLNGREFSKSYRYGFQNQEGDKELWEGAITYKYRVEDPRLGRFFSVDPLFAKYPWNSNYAFSENRLIDGVELEGLEYKNANESEQNAGPTPNLSPAPQQDYSKLDSEFTYYKIEQLNIGPDLSPPVIPTSTIKPKSDDSHLTPFEKGMQRSLCAGIEVASYIEGGFALKTLFQGGVKFLKLANVTDDGLEFVAYSTDDVADTYVYMSKNGGKTTYVGITNNVVRRQAEHGADRLISALSETKLTRYDARAVEQVLIEHFKLSKNGGTLENKINSIAKTNKMYSEALKRGAEILKQFGVTLP